MSTQNPTVRKGQGPGHVPRAVFRERFCANFVDPAFDAEREAIDRLEAIAWEAYEAGRKAPLTREAGPEFADPKYQLSLDWLAAKDRLRRAEEAFRDPAARSRVLVVCGASRNDDTCPGEASKSFRLTGIVKHVLEADGLEIDLLDLSLLTSEYGRHIFPCKACVSTAMPLCHWPCSCYPNHSLNQVNDAMAEIYERWVRAHGIVIATPVYWYQSPSPLKLMIDRLVCADGGNPDPTSTHGKDPARAKEIELGGWSYPKHLAGRVYGLVVHGDVAGVGEVKGALSEWLDWMGLVAAGSQAKLERYIGYYEPYATSHDALDRDKALEEEVANVGRAVAKAVAALRAGTLVVPDAGLSRPRPK